MLSLAGVHLPVTTSFTPGGELDLAHFRTNLCDWLSHSIGGIVIAGSTGEAPLLRRSELYALVEATETEIEGRVLLVGTGGEATDVVIDNSRAVFERGASAVLVRSPYYYNPAMRPDVLRDHFLRIADSCSGPVVLYHIPKFVPVDLTPELVGHLMEHENIIGIKDSSGDLKRLGAMVEACGTNGQVLVGSGSHLYAALEMGAAGGILGVAVIATRSSAQLYEAWQAGDHRRAGALQERIGPLHKKVVAGCGIAGVKAALDRIGLYGGPPRSPLRPATPEQVAITEEALSAAGLGVSTAHTAS